MPKDIWQTKKEAREKLALKEGRNLGEIVPFQGVEGDLYDEFLLRVVLTNYVEEKFGGSSKEEMVKMRDEIAGSMTTEQIAKAQRLARQWEPKTWEVLRQ